MTKKSLLSDEERQAFRSAVQGISPIKQSKLIYSKPKIKTAPKIYRQQEAEFELQDSLCNFADNDSVAKVQSEESLFFARNGLQHRAIKELRQGETPTQALLDLHGLSTDEAHDILHRFLMMAIERKWRCLRIIHGKGAHGSEQAPLLKNKVNQWLRRYPQVLAFSSAIPRDGGVGAVYVLLKR